MHDSDDTFQVDGIFYSQNSPTVCAVRPIIELIADLPYRNSWTPGSIAIGRPIRIGKRVSTHLDRNVEVCVGCWVQGVEPLRVAEECPDPLHSGDRGLDPVSGMRKPG